MNKRVDYANFRLTGLELRRMAFDKKLEDKFWDAMHREWDGPVVEYYYEEDEDE